MRFEEGPVIAFDGPQAFQKCRVGGRIVAHAWREDDSQAVGLQLLALVQPLVQQFLDRSVDHVLKRVRILVRVGQACFCNAGDLLIPLNDVEDVLLGDVTDLMAQHARKLGFVLNGLQQPACDEDVAGGGGERVDRIVVEDRKAILDVGAITGQGYRAADQIHVSRQVGLIVDSAVAGNYL